MRVPRRSLLSSLPLLTLCVADHPTEPLPQLSALNFRSANAITHWASPLVGSSKSAYSKQNSASSIWDLTFLPPLFPNTRRDVIIPRSPEPESWMPPLPSLSPSLAPHPANRRMIGWALIYLGSIHFFPLSHIQAQSGLLVSPQLASAFTLGPL